jgi:DNA polymerase III epsilon subunit-like protein
MISSDCSQGSQEHQSQQMKKNILPTSLIFDTETNGIPPKDPTGQHRFAPYREWRECRMLQLAWVIVGGNPDSETEILSKGNYYMRLPPDVMASPESTAIHGITDEEIQNMPPDMHKTREEVLCAFFDAIQAYGVETLVAHNLEFDYHILLNEILRTFPNGDPRRKLFKTLWCELKGFCTYRRGQHAIRKERTGSARGMPYVSGKLTSFYSYFVEPWETSQLYTSGQLQLHRADGDIELTRRLYERLYQRTL